MATFVAVIALCCLLASGYVRAQDQYASRTYDRCTQNSVTPVSCATVDSPDGLVPHPDDCQLFYYCVQPYLPPICRQCPANLHFNPVLHVCDWPIQAGCVLGTTTTEAWAKDGEMSTDTVPDLEMDITPEGVTEAERTTDWIAEDETTTDWVIQKETSSDWPGPDDTSTTDVISDYETTPGWVTEPENLTDPDNETTSEWTLTTDWIAEDETTTDWVIQNETSSDWPGPDDTSTTDVISDYETTPGWVTEPENLTDPDNETTSEWTLVNETSTNWPPVPDVTTDYEPDFSTADGSADYGTTPEWITEPDNSTVPENEATTDWTLINETSTDWPTEVTTDYEPDFSTTDGSADSETTSQWVTEVETTDSGPNNETTIDWSDESQTYTNEPPEFEVTTDYAPHNSTNSTGVSEAPESTSSSPGDTDSGEDRLDSTTVSSESSTFPSEASSTVNIIDDSDQTTIGAPLRQVSPLWRHLGVVW